MSHQQTVIVGGGTAGITVAARLRNADPTLDVTKQYDLQHPAGFISHRATVIVDKQGKVAFVQVQEKTGDPRDMAAVQAALGKLA